MTKNRALWMGLLFFLVFVALFVSLLHVSKSYRETGLKAPTEAYSVPLNERGNIVYITNKQDRNIKILLITTPIFFVFSVFFMYKGGVPFNSRIGLDFKK